MAETIGFKENISSLSLVHWHSRLFNNVFWCSVSQLISQKFMSGGGWAIRASAESVVLTVKHGSRSVIVWGCFVGWSSGDRVQIKGVMEKEEYYSIIQYYTIPSFYASWDKFSFFNTIMILSILEKCANIISSPKKGKTFWELCLSHSRSFSLWAGMGQAGLTSLKWVSSKWDGNVCMLEKVLHPR